MKVGCLLQPGFTTQGQCEITQFCSVPALTFEQRAVMLGQCRGQTQIPHY